MTGFQKHVTNRASNYKVDERKDSFYNPYVVVT